MPPEPSKPAVGLGAVVIGRNEQDNLATCLRSVPDTARVVYVDSGSSDGSVSVARTLGVMVVELSEPPNFTAARARNAGLASLLAEAPDLEFVQMVDGDCELRPGWIERGVAALRSDPGLGAVFGRQRERHPERSIFNALVDHDWDSAAVGDVSIVAGCVLFRVAALRDVDCYNASMIAGEDNELGFRLRQRGWGVRRIDAEMTWHDINITRWHQWWRRVRRAGHAYGELAYLHPDAADPDWPRTVRSIQFWGGVLPLLLVAAVLLTFVDPRWGIAAVLLLLPWPLNMARLVWQQRRRGVSVRVARLYGILVMAGKPAQFAGLLDFYLARLGGRAPRLIEYKGSGRA